MGLGGGGGGTTTQYVEVPTYNYESSESISPAVARSISKESEGQIQEQTLAKQRARGIAGTYATASQNTGAEKTKLGQ